MPLRPLRRAFEIAPFRGLRYALSGGEGAEAVCSPPYDVISPDEHRRLLALSPHNITHLTLGPRPGEGSSYEERGRLFRQWIADGVLRADGDPSFYVYVIDYAVPGSSGLAGAGGAAGAPRRARFVGWIALGRLQPFSSGVILPHERTFPKVVDDRLSLLEATRANLESILLLYSDPEGAVDGVLESQVRSAPLVRVEAKPGEFHELHQVCDVAVFIRLIDFLSFQRPIIADGHHRYTTSLRFWLEQRERGSRAPGSDWQLMTLANLRGGGLSILATHRLAKLRPGATSAEALDRLLSRFEVTDEADQDLSIETRERKVAVRFPKALREARKGVARTSYALLHDVVLGEWLRDLADEQDLRYFKESTGETEALARGEGDVLFRMRPVDPQEFQEVVQGGEVFPHKTTYFYPKLWSGLVLWQMDEPETLALK